MSDFKVTTVQKCSRCKREVPVEIDADDVPKYREALAKRVETLKAVEAFFRDKPDLPDLVVVLKGQVSSIDTVCDDFCKNTIDHALATAFRDIDPSKRAPRKTRTPEEMPTETEHAEEKSANNVVEEGAHPHADKKNKKK